jgi:pyruvate/2-oxoglutarate dehydrogenase complex dihydrolipoamide dehydrogenase (E3) component/uncharacterized membrane protein YdjX (TVP38/TMEM64 family)
LSSKQFIAVSLLVAALSSYFFLDLGSYLSLDQLKQSQHSMEQLYATQPLSVGAGFFVLYVLATALSFPGAAVLTLAAGALFGLGWGLLLVSFASSLGATLAFLLARFVLRDTLQKRYANQLKLINQGMARDGALYLFTLRLVPLVPFFVINLVMGLTQIRASVFYIISQLGMLAGTAVYVNAGTQLAQLDSLIGLVSPALLGSFALLAIFPWLAKWGMAGMKKRQVFARWKHLRPRQFDRNLIVIGAGAGGLVSAYIAAAVKARVTLVEAHKMGGDCLNYGCVPSKALIKSAKVAHQMRHAGNYGLHSVDDIEINANSVFSFKHIMQRIERVIAQIEPHDSVARYNDLGVEVLGGHAKIITPWTVEITLADGATQQLTTRSIVIAAGARPFVPTLPGLQDVGYVTSDTLWETFAKLDKVPKRLLVLGGGPIGCELAQSFARLGSHVTLVEMADRILLREDEDVSTLASQAMQADGVQLLLGHRAIRCEIVASEKMLVVEHAGSTLHLAFDQLLCALGRSARLTGYGLEELGIPVEKTIQTNEYLQTIYPNIFAAGDVAGPYQFTHTAAHQAWYASVNALFGEFKRFKADYRVIPQATFLDPEIARVGLNEQEAKAQGIAFEISQYELDDLDRAICESQTQGFVKVLTVPGKDAILGVTIVGANAAELLAEYVLAMKHGLGLNKILGTIHTYPTMAEANKYAAGVWKRAHQPTRLLAWVRRYHDWRRH